MKVLTPLKLSNHAVRAKPRIFNSRVLDSRANFLAEIFLFAAELKLKMLPYITRTRNELVLGGGAVGYDRPN